MCLHGVSNNNYVSEIQTQFRNAGIDEGKITEFTNAVNAVRNGNLTVSDLGAIPIDSSYGQVRSASVPPSSLSTFESKFDLKHRGPTSVLKLLSRTWTSVGKILTAYQTDYLMRNKYFPGVSYSSGQATKIDVNFAFPLGFYELHNVVSGMQDPVNTYTFVMDGDAPKPIDDGRYLIYQDYDKFGEIGGTVIGN